MNKGLLTRVCAVFAALCLILPTLATAQEASGTFNLLLIGYDSYTPEERGRSDCMILAQIKPESGDIKLVSFLRDIYAPISGHGSTRLNAAYYYGGANLLAATLDNCFGVRTDRFLAVDFATMANLVNQLGGIEVDVCESDRKQLNSILRFYNKKTGRDENDGLLAESGVQLLNGNQALSFSRIRKTDSDFKRSSRQHLVLLGVLKKLTTMDFVTLTGLAAQNIGSVSTNIELSDVTTLLPLLMNASGLRLRSVHVPFDGTYTDETINGMMVLNTNLTKNRKLICDFLNEE